MKRVAIYLRVAILGGPPVDRVYLAQRGDCLGVTGLYVTRIADLMPDPRTDGFSGSPLEAKALRGSRPNWALRDAPGTNRASRV
jgi:hypothetical protein